MDSDVDMDPGQVVGYSDAPHGSNTFGINGLSDS
jgi:hypothetical protein